MVSFGIDGFSCHTVGYWCEHQHFAARRTKISYNKKVRVHFITPAFQILQFILCSVQIYTR